MIYIHVPFCRSFCTYCDFYSEIACRGRDAEEMDAYLSGICDEIEARRTGIEAASECNTLYIGGGTPSVLPLSCLGQIVNCIGFPPFDEFTMEVNPEDIVENGPAYLHGLADLGVNRVSMGVQSLDDGILRWMNRRHDADGARAAFKMLRAGGVRNVSVDIIFGLSQLSLQTLAATLDEIILWHPEHVSAYQLSIEDGSALAGMVSAGKYAEASDDQCAEQYLLVCERLREAGYDHYEISNWALPGFEAIHNSAYWNRTPYVGLGPGAHSFSGSIRSWNSRHLSGWKRTEEILSGDEEREEKIMLGLRTARGIPASLCSPETVGRLVSEGALSVIRLQGEDFIRIPEDRFFVSDDIIDELV